MTTKEKTRIFQCLQCPVFRNSFIDYIINFYPCWKKYEETERFSSSQDFKEFKEALQDLVKDMHIKCSIDFDNVDKKDNSFYELAIAMGSLSKKGERICASVPPETSNCVKFLNHILPLLIPYYYYGSNADFNPESDFDSKLESIKYPVEGFSGEYHYIFKLMDRLVNNTLINHKSITPLSDDYSDNRLDAYKLINDYCKFDKEIRFKYCNPDLAEWNEYDNLCDCRDIETQRTASQTTPSLEGLNSQSKKILYEFLLSVPKAFGENLSRIMQIHGMTENDLSKILYDTENKANRIQALCKCRTHNQSPKQIKKLARALLVSEDVLYTGRGVIFGNWKELLNQYEYKDIMETLGVRTKSESKEEIRYIIKEMINQEDDEFEKMLNHEFFYKQPCYLYLRDCANFMQIVDHRIFHTEHYGLSWKRVEDESLYDFNAMYKAALYPEYIDILVSVLRENQSVKQQL